MQLRKTVFIEEQHVPQDLEWDGLDGNCIHFIAHHQSQAIATARMKPDGHIGRMAVLKPYRNNGVGSSLLTAAIQLAKTRGLKKVYLHAQVTVIGFYQKHGFETQGTEFMDAGIVPCLKFCANCRRLAIFYKLGKSKAEVTIHTAEENKNAAISLAKQARYTVNIFSQELDATLYDNAEFEKSIINLARKHPDSRIRILVQDPHKAMRDGHRLIRVSQHLTSSVFIRKPAREHKSKQSAFMSVDGCGLLFRAVGNQYNYEAVVSFMSPNRIGKLDEFFNEVWEHAEVDLDLRRLYV